MNLHSLNLSEKTSLDFAPPPSRASILRRWMLHHLLLRREHQSFEDGCCTTYCCEPAGEATRKRLFRIDEDSVYSRGGGNGLHDLHFTSQDTRERYSAQGPRTEEGLRGHQRSRLLDTRTARSKRCLVTDGTPIKCAWNGPWLQYFDMGGVHHGRKLPPGESASEEPRFSEHFISLISRGEVKCESVSASFSPY